MRTREFIIALSAVTAAGLNACAPGMAGSSVLEWKNIEKDAKKYVESMDSASQDPCRREVKEWYYLDDGNRIEILVDCKNAENELLKLVVDRRLKRVVAVVPMGRR